MTSFIEQMMYGMHVSVSFFRVGEETVCNSSPSIQMSQFSDKAPSPLASSHTNSQPDTPPEWKTRSPLPAYLLRNKKKIK